MTDEALQRLGRWAQARPEDLAVGWAHARALERAGARRELHLALCRLARAGDPDALARITRWVGPGAARPMAALPDLHRLRGRVVRVEQLRDACALGVWNDRAYLGTAGGFLAVDLDEGTTCWSAPCSGWAFMRGDDVVILGDTALSVRDLDGRPLGSARLPWAPHVAAMVGDRLVLGRDAAGRAQVLAMDVGEAVGRTLWSVELAEGGDLHVGGSLVVRITSTLRVETLDLETGASRDLGPLTGGDGPERRIVGLALDPLQETLAYSLAPPVRHSFDFSFSDPPPEEVLVAWLGEIDLRTSETRWCTTLQGSAGRMWLERHQVVTHFDDVLLALDRVTGAVRWRAPLGRSRYPLGVEHAEGHLVCVSAELAVEARLSLRAFDLHTGELRGQAQRVLPTRSLLAPLGWRAPVFWRPALALDDAGLRFLWPGHRDLIVLDAPSSDGSDR